MQAVETKREILVWTDTALNSMRFIGPPFTFGLQQLASNITIMSPNAAVATEDVVFWMGIDNFYVYAGQTQQLPCTVKDKVFLDFNFEQADKVISGVNSEFSEVFWFYPSDSSSDNDKYVVYNYGEKVVAGLLLVLHGSTVVCEPTRLLPDPRISTTTSSATTMTALQ